MNMVELIERLEKASGPDREMDRAIFDAVTGGVFGPENRQFWHSTTALSRAANEFTSSIDAALTLVPEGWEYQILHTGSLPYVSGKTHCAHIKAPFDGGWYASPNWTGDANSAAIALCIAALKARASIQETEK